MFNAQQNVYYTIFCKIGGRYLEELSDSLAKDNQYDIHSAHKIKGNKK